MNTIKLQQRGTLTLPKKIRESLKLDEGDVFQVVEGNNSIILNRVVSHNTHLLEEINQSLNEIKKGKFIEFGSIPEFKKKLKSYDAH